MSNVIFWPNDFSPAYDVEYNDKREFVRLNAVWSFDPGYPGAEQREITQGHIDYIKNKAWDKVSEAIRVHEWHKVKVHKKYKNKETGEVIKVFATGKVKYFVLTGDPWQDSVCFYDKGVLKTMTVSDFLFEFELKQ